MKRRAIITSVLLGIVVFLVWRFIRPMNIFVVDDRFAWPIDTTQTPAVLGKLSARECSVCHQDFYDEWRTTIHSQAWTDPYFRADWQFEDAQHSCRLCHTPLDRQLPHKVLGYRDKDQWEPILADNPDFDPALQHEGVSCAACHYREGKIVGVLGDTSAPHPVKKIEDPNQVCVRCHIVAGERWDTLFRFPPCGTVAEIDSTPGSAPIKRGREYLLPRVENTGANSASDTDAAFNALRPEAVTPGESGEIVASDTRSLRCVQCHMPLVERPLVEKGPGDG